MNSESHSEPSLMERVHEKLESGHPIDTEFLEELKHDPEASDYWHFWTQGSGLSLSQSPLPDVDPALLQRILSIPDHLPTQKTPASKPLLHRFLPFAIAALFMLCSWVGYRILFQDQSNASPNLQVESSPQKALSSEYTGNIVTSRVIEQEKQLVQSAVENSLHAMLGPLTIFKTITSIE